MKKFFASICLLLITATPVFPFDVTLSWDANTEPDLVGYRVYHSTESGNYTDFILETPETRVTVTVAESGYFVVTAYDSAGQESGYSNEVKMSPANPTGCIIERVTK